VITLQLKNTIYIVDSKQVISDALSLLLSTYDTQVRTFDNNRSFLNDCASSGQIDCCLIIEAQLSADSEFSTLQKLRELGHTMPVIILTDTLTPSIRARALALDVTDILEFPLMNGFLIARLQQLMPSIATLQSGNPRVFVLKDGMQITIRAMEPEDADIEQAFVRSLSPESMYMRFFSMLKQLSPGALDTLTHNEFPAMFAAIATNTHHGLERQIGVARYMNTKVKGVAEFAVVVADEFQMQGIATKLLNEVVTAASIAGLDRLEGSVLKENRGMLNLALSLGFQIRDDPEDHTLVKVYKSLFIGNVD
jgi:FixJ family two-component response regulator/GNAT superfamily N-acetyltransferase